MTDIVSTAIDFSTLDTFLNEATKDSMPMRKTLDLGPIRIYLRKTDRFILDEVVPTIDIGNVEVHPELENQGIFTKVLEHIETNTNRTIYVENILTDRLANFFTNRGYEVVENHELYTCVARIKS